MNKELYAEMPISEVAALVTGMVDRQIRRQSIKLDRTERKLALWTSAIEQSLQAIDKQLRFFAKVKKLRAILKELPPPPPIIIDIDTGSGSGAVLDYDGGGYRWA